VAENVYTIKGADILGKVVVTVEKNAGQATVTVEGNGAGIATGYNSVAVMDQPYILTVTPEAGYIYTVTATMSGSEITLTPNTDNTTYTTPAVTGDLVFTITAEVDTSSVKVSEKVTVQGGSVYAVRYQQELPEKKVPTYNGNAMYWSENHQEYIYLIIAGTLNTDDAKAEIGITTGTPVTVEDSSDINGSNTTDASDAQYVWNMYKAQYSEFTAEVTMEEFIKADRNADYKIDMTDAQVIIKEILGIAATE